MNGKNKFIMVICASALAVGSFIVSTRNVDVDGTIVQWKDTVNGKYVRDLAVAQHNEVVESKKAEESKPSVQMPENGEYSEMVKVIENLNIDDRRKAICLEAIDTVQKQCIYHQIRGANNLPTMCMKGCDGETRGEYDYKTQAAYNIEDPWYLDCSYFVKHCYWKAGLEMISGNTGGMYTNGEWETIAKDKLLPGDIAVRNNGRTGHVLIYLGDGMWAELKNHANNSVISRSDPMADSRYIARRFKVLGGN